MKECTHTPEKDPLEKVLTRVKIEFFDAFVHFFLNFGQIGNFNKSCQFPLQEACNKRVLLWNEPEIEPSKFEELKLLFGGDTMNVKIKFQGDQVLHRTSVIILANNNPFSKNEAFSTRMFTYEWQYMPDLKYVQKKPNPIAFYDSLNKNHILN